MSVAGLAQLRVRLLGGLEVEGVDSPALGSRKARTLVKVLALARGATVSSDTVIEVLWPDDDVPARPAEQVGVLVSRLRSVLGPHRLRRSDAGWALDVDWLDLIELEARVDEAAARLAAGNTIAARAAARAALAVVRGELLADEPERAWADAECNAVARTIARARSIGAEAALIAGDAGEAAALAEGALDHDPYDEAALRVLMRAHAAAGRPASALAAYARVREQLSEDLGVDPAPETDELHTSILLADALPARPGSSASPPTHALVGRDSELAALTDLLGRARTGQSTLAVVQGEAGIGKTTLVTSWSGRLLGEALVIHAHCDELGRDLPLQPILDGLEAHLRTLDSDEVAACMAGAEPVLGPLLGRFSAGTGQPGPTTVADPAAGRAFLFAALLATIERAAGQRSAVVIVEDAHLAGASTIEWMRFAVRRGKRILVLATRRPEGPSLGPATLLTLGPLDLESVVKLVGTERAPELHARSGGHPLFLQELANATSAELPSSVREAVAARVDEMGDAASTLRAAAVLGSEVDVDLLAGVLDLPVRVLLNHLDAGVRTLLVVERAGRLSFRHELVREALVADTTAARRAFVHREAARVLWGRPGHDPLEVAWHARFGGDIRTGVAALVDAAANAADRYDMTQADQLLSEAIALEDNVEARVARARVRIARFDLDGAEVDGARALQLGGGSASLELAGWAAYYKRNYHLALQRADEAIQRADDAALRASCLTLSGRVLHASGLLVEADQRLSEAVAGAPVEVRGVAQVFLGALRVHQGRVDEGAALVERALLDPTRLGHPFALHHGYLMRVLGLGMRGQPIEALAAAEAGSVAAVQAGESGTRFVAVQANVRSWLLRSLGRLDEADDSSQRSLEMASRHRGAMDEMYYAARLDLIDGRLLARDLEGAARLIEATSEVLDWHGVQAWHHHQRYLSQCARHSLATGDQARAAAFASDVMADGANRRTRRYPLIAQLTLARVQLAAGDAIDHDDCDRVLAELDQCAGLEGWYLTAELAAASGMDRWWRDAERRAGALVARAGEHAETLRRYVASTFAALGR